MTIVGKNFSLLDIPYVDNLPLRNVSVTSDSIKGVIPSGIRKAGVIRLRRKKVTVASTKKFDFVKKPIIRSVSPKSARPGEEVTIKGKFLDNVSQIFIDDIPQEMLNCSAKSVSFVVSPTSTTGILGIKTPGGQATLKRPYKVIK
ncbi:MAG: hypothetical protein GY847_21830 [Proteobacteria bacterium]|nr:hypothetical protein [Pseudomonadota bacterium]